MKIVLEQRYLAMIAPYVNVLYRFAIHRPLIKYYDNMIISISKEAKDRNLSVLTHLPLFSSIKAHEKCQVTSSSPNVNSILESVHSNPYNI